MYSAINDTILYQGTPSREEVDVFRLLEGVGQTYPALSKGTNNEAQRSLTIITLIIQIQSVRSKS